MTCKWCRHDNEFTWPALLYIDLSWAVFILGDFSTDIADAALRRIRRRCTAIQRSNSRIWSQSRFMCHYNKLSVHVLRTQFTLYAHSSPPLPHSSSSLPPGIDNSDYQCNLPGWIIIADQWLPADHWSTSNIEGVFNGYNSWLHQQNKVKQTTTIVSYCFIKHQHE